MAQRFVGTAILVISGLYTSLHTLAVDSSVVHSIYIANIHGTNSATVNIEVSTDGAGSANFFHVAKTIIVPADSTLILDKPVNLFNASKAASPGDLMRATADAASMLEAFVSVLEITL